MRRIRHGERMQITGRVHGPVPAVLALAAVASSGAVTRRSCLIPTPCPGFFSLLGHTERDGLCSLWARRRAAMSAWAARWARDSAELPPCREGGG